MKFKDIKNQPWFPYTVASCSAVILLVLLSNLPAVGQALHTVYAFISPVVIGIIIAYVIDPLVVIFENKVFRKMRHRQLARTISVVLSLLIVLSIIALIIVALVPQIGNSISTLARNFKTYVAQTEEFFEGMNAKLAAFNLDLSSVMDQGKQFLESLTKKLPELLDKVLEASSDIGSKVMNWVLGLILAIYFLMDKNRILEGARYLLNLLMTNARYKSTIKFLDRCNAIMIKYIVCEVMEALVIGGINFLFMLILQMPYAVLISVIIGITNMVPTFGPIVGGVIGGFILLLIDPWKALAFIIFTIILQTVDGYILKPKMYGDTLGVSSILILIFIIVGGKMFGVVGILLSIPLAAILHFLYHEVYLPHMKGRKRNRYGEQPLMETPQQAVKALKKKPRKESTETSEDEKES